MPNEFTVVGENKDDQSELLVLGADGHYYEYDLTREQISRIELDEQWELFPGSDEATFEF